MDSAKGFQNYPSRLNMQDKYKMNCNKYEGITK